MTQKQLKYQISKRSNQLFFIRAPLILAELLLLLCRTTLHWFWTRLGYCFSLLHILLSFFSISVFFDSLSLTLFHFFTLFHSLSLSLCVCVCLSLSGLCVSVFRCLCFILWVFLTISVCFCFQYLSFFLSQTVKQPHTLSLSHCEWMSVCERGDTL